MSACGCCDVASHQVAQPELCRGLTILGVFSSIRGEGLLHRPRKGLCVESHTTERSQDLRDVGEKAPLIHFLSVIPLRHSVNHLSFISLLIEHPARASL
jgi:hypothetical protein